MSYNGACSTISGVSVRWSDCETLEQMWKKMLSEQSLVKEIPEDRKPWLETDIRFGVWSSSLSVFDPIFFSIPPKESLAVDPAQRLALVTSWEAMEDAGLQKSDLSGFGVYAGASSDYFYKLMETDDPTNSSFWSLGNGAASCAGRLSFFFGCFGPSVAVDAACASSLVALSIAVSDLKAAAVSGCVVVGSQAITCHLLTGILSRTGLLAKDGRCKTFDAAADGYGRADATVTAIVQHVREAKLEARLDIMECLSGHDGNTKRSFVQTSYVAQANLMNKMVRDCLNPIGIESHDLSLYFPHGNGNPSSDADEISAIGSSYGMGRTRDKGLIASSTKTVTGHSESASAALTIALLCLTYSKNVVPRHINFKLLHPAISGKVLEACQLSICLEETKWMEDYSAETSFGVGGALAHAFFCRPFQPDQKKSDHENEFSIPLTMPLTAANDTSLKDLSRNYIDFLIEDSATTKELSETSKTRTKLSKRMIILFDSRKDLIERLRDVKDIGSHAFGLDGFFQEEKLSFTEAILCLGDFQKKKPLETFEKSLSIGSQLLENGVRFSKTAYSESPAAFALPVILGACSEDEARTAMLSASITSKIFFKVFYSKCMLQKSIFGAAKGGSILETESYDSFDCARCFGLRFIIDRKCVMAGSVVQLLSSFGVQRHLQSGKRDELYIMIGRSEDIWSTVRRGRFFGLQAVCSRGKWKDTIFPCISVVQSVRIMKKRSNRRAPTYPFQKKVCWTQHKLLRSHNKIVSESIDDIVGNCDYCNNEVLAKDIVFREAEVLHVDCVEKYDEFHRKCYSCGIILEKQKSITHDNVVLHQRCFEENFMCVACNSSIPIKDVIQFNDLNYHGKCVLKARKKDFECEVCGEILDEEFLVLNGSKIHAFCLSKKNQRDALRKQEILKSHMQKVGLHQAHDSRTTTHVAPKERSVHGSTISERLISIFSFCFDLPDISKNSLFVELGMSSLSGIKIRTLIQQHTGVLLPPNFSTEFNSVGDVISFVEKLGVLTDPESESTNIRCENEVDEIWGRLFGQRSFSKSLSGAQKGNAVFITGASGFLGGEILKYLAFINVKVFCVVRAKTSKEARIRVQDILQSDFDEKRILVFAGDLEKEDFGMDERVLESIGKSCSFVIHGAALVNWTASYQYLKQANVVGTANVLSFASRFGLGVVYVSTLGILNPFMKYNSTDEDCATSLIAETFERWEGLPTDQRGYTMSKFVGELLVRKYATETGLDAVIVRVPFLGPSSKTGRMSTDQYDIRMFLSILKSGSFFKQTHQVAKLHWIPVDYCAECLWKIGGNMNLFKSKFEDILLHLVHPLDGTAISQICRCFESFGYKLNPISKEDWLNNVDRNDLPTKPFVNMLKLGFDELPLNWRSKRLELIKDEFQLPSFSITNTYLHRMCQVMSHEGLIPFPDLPDSSGVPLDYVIRPLDQGYAKTTGPVLVRVPILLRLVQLVMVVFLAIFISTPLYPVVFFLDWTFSVAWWGIFLIPLSVPIFSGTFMIQFVLLKWCLLGRVRPGTHALWSFFFCRWWFIYRLRVIGNLSLVGKGWIENNFFSWLFYRCLGSSIHWTATLRAEVFDNDLISIGKNAGTEQTLYGHVFERNGSLCLGKIHINAGGWVSRGAYVLPGGSVPYCCRLAPGALVTSSLNVKHIAPQSSLIGSDNPEVLPNSFSPNTENESLVLLLLRSTLMVLLRSYVIVGSVAPSIWIFFYLERTYGPLWNLLSLICLIPLAAAIYLLVVIVLKWLLLGSNRCFKNKIRTYHWKGWFAFRRDLFLSTRDILFNPMQEILSFSPWANNLLRLLGSRIKGQSSIGSIDCGAEWDNIDIGKGSFIGIRVTLQTCTFNASKIILSKIVIGDNCFVGNFSVICGSFGLGNFCQVLPASRAEPFSYAEEVCISGNPAFPVSMIRQNPPAPQSKSVFLDLLFSFAFWTAISACVACSLVIVKLIVFQLSFVYTFGNMYYFSAVASIGLLAFLASFGVEVIFCFSVLYNLFACFEDKRDKAIHYEKFKAIVLGPLSMCSHAVGGSFLSNAIWKFVGARLGRLCYMDFEFISRPELITCDDTCAILGSVDIGFGENTDCRRIGLVLGSGSVLERGSFIIDGFCSKSSVVVLPSAVPDNLTSVSRNLNFLGFFHQGKEGILQGNPKIKT